MHGRRYLEINLGYERTYIMKLTGRLIEAMRSEFAKSKKWYRKSIFVTLSMLAISAILIFCSSGIISILLGMSLFVFPIMLFIFRELSLEHQDRAENIRR